MENKTANEVCWECLGELGAGSERRCEIYFCANCCARADAEEQTNIDEATCSDETLLATFEPDDDDGWAVYSLPY